MPQPLDAGATIRRLGLTPHPEGGFYRETFRSPLTLTLADGRTRSASTSIYYLLPGDARSAWHRMAADEVWHHYAGGALRLYRLGLAEVTLDAGRPQAVVPAGVWQAAEPADQAVLAGCTVAPGFELEDFTLGNAEELIAAYPGEEALIRRLTR